MYINRVLKEERSRGKNFLINAIVRWTGSGMAIVTCAQTGSTLLNALDIVRRIADVTKVREGLCGYEEQNRRGERGVRSSPMTGGAKGANVCAECTSTYSEKRLH